jgi:ATP-dependent Clp protease ATP-binding subunit ClpC
MFERFTDRARAAIASAQQQPRRFGHTYVGTEHLLLGLSEGDGIAARALQRKGFDRDRFEAAVVESVGRSEGPDAPDTPHLPFTPRAKRVLEESLRQSLTMGHNYIGTEHVLLGLLDDDGSLATKLLAEQAVTAATILPVVVQLLLTFGATGAAATGAAATGAATAAETEGTATAAGAVARSSDAPARCPGCHLPLAGNLGAELIASVGEVERPFTVAHCRGCGHVLAVLPDG